MDLKSIKTLSSDIHRLKPALLRQAYSLQTDGIKSGNQGFVQVSRNNTLRQNTLVRMVYTCRTVRITVKRATVHNVFLIIQVID